ncbi:MAG: DNA repair protein RadC [Chitinophagaceae bacterium]
MNEEKTPATNIAFSIKNWAEDDRPREKLLSKGKSVLSDAELLAIIINNGTRDESAVQVCKRLLLAVDNSLDRLARLSVQEILRLKVKGIGPAKAIAIVSALELGVRRDASTKKKEVIGCSEDAAQYLKAKFQHLSEEVFIVLYLNNANKINHLEMVSHGGRLGTVVDVQVILKKALEHNAVKMVCAHNHPSGALRPSQADKDLTRKIAKAAALLDIALIDHIIVSDSGFFSFADEGLM